MIRITNHELRFTISTLPMRNCANDRACLSEKNASDFSSPASAAGYAHMMRFHFSLKNRNAYKYRAI